MEAQLINLLELSVQRKGHPKAFIGSIYKAEKEKMKSGLKMIFLEFDVLVRFLGNKNLLNFLTS